MFFWRPPPSYLRVWMTAPANLKVWILHWYQTYLFPEHNEIQCCYISYTTDKSQLRVFGLILSISLPPQQSRCPNRPPLLNSSNSRVWSRQTFHLLTLFAVVYDKILNSVVTVRLLLASEQQTHFRSSLLSLRRLLSGSLSDFSRNLITREIKRK